MLASFNEAEPHIDHEMNLSFPTFFAPYLVFRIHGSIPWNAPYIDVVLLVWYLLSYVAGIYKLHWLVYTTVLAY